MGICIDLKGQILQPFRLFHIHQIQYKVVRVIERRLDRRYLDCDTKDIK